MRSRLGVGAVTALAIGTWTPLSVADVTVDANADAHPISPLIYGVNFPSAAQITTGNLTVMRRGGNSTTRYNYLVDVHNTGSDWFFENIPDCAGCADPKGQSSANAFLTQAATSGLVALFTMPTIGWTPKASSPTAHPYACGCPSTVTAAQECFDQYDTNCGDGRTGGSCGSPGNTWVTCAPPSSTSDVADTAFVKGWAQYLVSKFGAANSRRIYELDNEPALWSSTHHDVHPSRLGYDELWQRMRDYGAAILEADPTGELAGPVEWGWPNYFCSDLDVVSNGCSANSPDRKNHGGTELVAWLLDQAKAYEQANATRVLHYLDLHYYPQGGSGPVRTRSLWDPTYTDPSWINDKIRLIPRMRDWVAQHYPGTKISISEYDFYDHDTSAGAVTYAEALGIFGRESLDMATAWGAPAATERAFSAFKLFRNYDGAGSTFESTSIRATSTDANVKAFAAASATRLTLMLANEGGSTTTASVTLSNFSPDASASVYSNDGTANVTAKSPVSISGGTLSVPLAATSITMVVVAGAGTIPPGSGGATGSGGAANAGGATSTGGAVSAGGTTSAGGATGAAGVSSTGGASTGVGGSGGLAAGGASNGGAGATSSGGTAGSSAGGATVASGATSSTGATSGGAGAPGGSGAAPSGPPGGSQGPDASTVTAPAAKSGDSGGCTTSRRSPSGSGAWLLGAVVAAWWRRRWWKT